MKKIKSYLERNWLFLVILLMIAILGHIYFLKNQILNNQYMASTGDQLTQMMPFKDFLYRQFTQGNFFFSLDYGGGDNFFTRLSYYYSTSIFLYFSILITYILELMNLVTPNIVYWSSSIVIISIMRTFFILLATTKYIQYFKVDRKFALLSASFYAYAIIYFRHVALWEFFADGMLWLPLLLYGAEKVLQENKGTLFSIAVALSVFNNGYFAYINLLFTGIYVLLRLGIRFSKDQYCFLQIKTLLVNGVIGLLIGLPGFLPFAIGFLSNSRIPSEISVQLSNFEGLISENPLFNSTLVIVPVVFFFLVFYFDNLRDKKFIFFSLLSVIMILFSNSTLIGSIFNGFSASQNRWQYMISLTMAVAIGIGLQNISKLTYSKFAVYSFISIVLTFLLYFIVYQNMSIENETVFTRFWWIFLVIQASILFILRYTRKKIGLLISLTVSFGMYFLITIESQRILYYDYELYKTDKNYINEKFYDDKHTYNQIFSDIESENPERFTRVDYRTQKENGSLQYETNEFHVYNSFINGNYHDFERNFEILNQGRGQASRMEGLGNRKILNSLLNVDYFIGKSGYYAIPYDYESVRTYEDKELFMNENRLAFIHPVRNLYSSNEFDKYDYKDSYLVNGAIVESEYSSIAVENSSVKDTAYDFNIKISNGKLNGRKLTPTSEENITIKITISREILENEQLSMGYTLIPTNTSKEVEYIINEEKFTALGPKAKYSSQVFDKQIVLDTTDQITIQLPNTADYNFEIHKIHGINYQELRERSQEDKKLEYEYSINSDNINILFSNDDDYPFMVLPMFNMPGWDLEVNGKDTEIIEANYGMIGFFLPNGEIEIDLTFRQPFFVHSIVLSTIGILVLIILYKKKN